VAVDRDDRAPADDPADEQPVAAPEQPAPATDTRERFGPLALQRMTKEDGRALIVYAAEPDGTSRA